MLAQPKNVELIIVAGVGSDALEHRADGRPAKLRDVDRALIPGPAVAIPPYVFGMRDRLIH
jgi:hypothetical protein